jgi:tetratricopeptide (TPR) repeat protein
MTRFAHVVAMILLVGTIGRCEDFDAALSRARDNAEHHRFSEAIEILLPFFGSDDPEVKYITAAELGRAYFHLGRYEPANRAFREAVAIHPEQPETAIYLEASSYLIGDTKQAYLIFEELLRSGARDLYLAVTLPGSRRFLADPEVQAILVRHAIPLEVDAGAASVMGVALGDTHDAVIKRLAAAAADPTARTLTAEAGPAVIWAFAFDDQQRLTEIVLYAGNLLDFTPYRLHFADGIDWTATPAAAIAVWGPPTAILFGDDSSVGMTWSFGDHHVTVNFGPGGAARPPDLPEGAAMIRTVRLGTGEPTP